MIYQLIKVIHITSVIVFIGGLLMLVVPAKTNNLAVLRVVRRWDRFFTTPALGLVWTTGFMLAMQGQWFGEVWLTIKLIVVIALSGLHGACTGTLRRIALDTAAAEPEFFRYVGVAIIAAVTVIAFLVTTKPA